LHRNMAFAIRPTGASGRGSIAPERHRMRLGVRWVRRDCSKMADLKVSDG
jgi:hypothetical protein